MKSLLATTIVLVLAASAALSAAQTGQDLLQQALVKERAEGNLKEAIELYQRIVREFSADRGLAARALVQIGQCYEKLGQAEARKAYEQVVRDYADQPEQVKLARERLAVLRKAATTAGAQMAVRKVWASSWADVLGAVSRDGLYLSFVDWTTGDLAVRDLETGKNRRLTNKGSWQQSQEFALFSRWSPDGKQLAYDWYVYTGTPTPDSNELRIVRLEDSQSRVLYKEARPLVVTCDWSPDGKEILAFRARADGKETRLVAISVADGSMRPLKIMGEVSDPALGRFSPDGRYILYSVGPGKGASGSDLFLLSADGKREFRVEHPANETALGWSADGDWVLFLSDRTGSLDLWALPVSGGKPRGEPRVVTSSVGSIVPLGVTRQGAFYYAVAPRGRDIYTARLDPQSGAVQVPPAKAVERFERSNDWPEYSPDGRRLAYVSARRSVGMARRRYNLLCIRSVETGKEQEFPTAFARLAGPRWSPDGRAVYVAAWDAKDAMGIYRVYVGTGAMSAVVEAKPPASLQWHDLSGDGKAVIYVQSDKVEGPNRILVRDLASGQEKEIYRTAPGERVVTALSPDRRWLALFSRPRQVQGDRVLSVMPASGGESREVYRFPQFGRWWMPLAWSADGKYLLFPKVPGSKFSPEEPPPKWELWRVPVAGGEAQKLGLEMTEFGGISAHPDGHQIAFASGGSETPEGEVWVMENFLPEAKAGQQ